MIKEFRLPDLGEGLTESEILSWKIAVGDTVELNQVIAEVETAKAVVELPSPFAGKVAALHEQPGAVVEVGKPIVSFEVSDDAPAATAAEAPLPPASEPAPPPASEPAPPPAAELTAASLTARTEATEPTSGSPGEAKPAVRREPNLVGYGAFVEETGRPVRRARRLMETSTATLPAQPSTRPRSTPPVRKLARDLGVDLASVPGTGPQGLITREDVQGYVGKDVGGATEGETGVGQPLVPDGAAARERTVEREQRVPIKGVRKHTAAAMVASAFTAPHVTEFLTIDVTAAMDLLDRLKASRLFAGHKLTPLTLVAKALLVALRRNPTLNSRWDEENQEIVQFNYVNLGIAAATPRGLTVPNIKDADAMPLLELSEALSTLTEAARAGKSTPSDLSGGTISITNIGVFGIDAGTPILNPGEAAILAMGAVRKAPWEFNGGVALRQVMTLSLSFDHRLVDGEQGSRFLADVGSIMSDPAMVLTMV
ncbi:dihydrolipoamide acetyltransferase family protein [Arthrobacter sp. ISL-30]|uniref:dihydrolipoamide acetyltransferase family protein n=1 Tax=Arthrobacter sp. ISL-30 TaxID=2819109 RepID=UPI001BEA18F6|nr:dihydrolipoamide acetyltransferase family protein [Arthrobacter sp. ISL-30]MBT2513115.1 2-oxo acid dehydrogenase subunit E2 [Arthrobacter sp. ISL-30]